MPTNVIMPALELAQETGKVLKWLKRPGDRVTKGEPIVEIETDKVTVEIEAPAAGVLRDVTAQPGDVVPVGQTIALIFAAGEAGAAAASTTVARSRRTAAAATPSVPLAVKASPLARRVAEQHGVDLAAMKTASGRIEKADVLAYVERTKARRRTGRSRRAHRRRVAQGAPAGRRARRRSAGGPRLRARRRGPGRRRPRDGRGPRWRAPAAPRVAAAVGVSNVWRIMAERMTTSWTSAPHFYLVREVTVSRLATWRERASKQTGARITYTDLLVRLVAATIAQQPRVNASWKDGTIVQHADINIGLAVAIDDGLVVPVLHRADTLSLAEIAARREDLVTRAQTGKLRPADIQGGSFTISNLGMYGVDAFNAIVNPPQAAILAVGRIADRVVAVGGQPAVQPTMVLTLSCDHRALDGARAAQFLGTLADVVEEPLTLLA